MSEMPASYRRLESNPRTVGWAAFGLLAVVVAGVYGPAARAPFVYDDSNSVRGNSSITRLSPLFGTVESPGPLRPPQQSVTSGRPLVNLSFALNYHFGTYDTLGYHLVNMVLHLLSAGVLFGLVRRTLGLARLSSEFGAAATPLAFAVALVWAVHPLQTDAVEYISQRTEVMMGFFYLTTLYASLRYFTAETLRGRTLAGITAAAACFLGMACKEVMVTAPLVVILFDRTFVSGSLRKAIEKSWPLYAALISSWLVLLALNVGAPRSKSAGFNAGIPADVWWLTQAKVLLWYLKLVVWPWPLVIHHEMPLVSTLGDALLWLIPVAILAWVSASLLWWKYPAGFLAASVLIILSPTLIVPIPTEVAAERRMYLPLAALIVLVIVGGYWALVRLKKTQFATSAARFRWSPLVPVLAGCALVTAVYCAVSSLRLGQFRDGITIWSDAVAREPENIRATLNLGFVYDDEGHYQEAIQLYERALAINPEHWDAGIAHRSLGLAWAKLHQPDKAIDQLQLAMQLRPDQAKDHGVLGAMLLDARRFDESVDELELAVRQQPDDVLTRSNLAAAYANLGKGPQAIAAAEKALALANAQGATSSAAQLDSWLKTYRGLLTRTK